jgi:hypothetical protein
MLMLKEYNFSEEFRLKAKKLNLKIIYPLSTELFIDVDTEDDYARFVKALHTVQKQLECNIVYSEWSKSGAPKRHIILDFPNEDFMKNEWKRLALQMFLGSDPRRENLNMIRLLINGNPENIFFERNIKPVEAAPNVPLQINNLEVSIHANL